MPRCSRNRSMSAMRCAVVFVDRSTTGSDADGVLAPHWRWSNWTMRYRAGSNIRLPRRIAAPGPP